MLKNLFLACLGFIELENLDLQSISGEPNLQVFHESPNIYPWCVHGDYSDHTTFVLLGVMFLNCCCSFLVASCFWSSKPSFRFVGGALGSLSDNITFRRFSSLLHYKASSIVGNGTWLKTHPRTSSRSRFNPTRKSYTRSFSRFCYCSTLQVAHTEFSSISKSNSYHLSSKSVKYWVTDWVPCFISFNFDQISNTCDTLPRSEYIRWAISHTSLAFLRNRYRRLILGSIELINQTCTKEFSANQILYVGLVAAGALASSVRYLNLPLPHNNLHGLGPLKVIFALQPVRCNLEWAVVPARKCRDRLIGMGLIRCHRCGVISMWGPCHGCFCHRYFSEFKALIP